MSSLSLTFDSQRTARRDAPADGVLAEGSTVGAYEVRRRLGSGAMGAVYAAWDPRLEREVALKVLHLDGDLLVEARLLAKLSHPNVVAVHEVLSWNERAVLVMELVRGQTLRGWLAQPRRTNAEVLATLQQCAEGLAAAHAAGIVHRDFKPDNVLVDENGRARLVDFGLALQGRVGGGLAGSPAYMPLRQLEGAPADARSDQYAWWVTTYEALTGRVPHDAPTLEGLIAARRTGEIDLAKIPRWLRSSVLRGLSHDPSRRFASMREAASAITPPRRFGRVFAAVVALAAAAVMAWPAPSPCDQLPVTSASLLARTQVPALVNAVNAYADAQVACRELPKQAQAERARCLEVVGRELDVALDALAISPGFPPALSARVLKRVRPAARCGRPSPPLSTAEPDRAALLESLRAQLRFDALRAQGDFQAAADLASQHARAVDTVAGPTVRAWAGLNEASALSTIWQADKTTRRLRELERIAGIGAREQTWILLGRWMFECHTGSREHCHVAQAQAERAVADLDEPWANAFALEVRTVASQQPPPVAELIAAWRAIPGADFELQRAISNELNGALVSSDPVRRREALTAARGLTLDNLRARQAQLSLEVAVAVEESDLAAAAAALAALDALTGDGPDLQSARFDARWLTLLARGDAKGALELASRMPTNEPRARYRRLLIEFSALTELENPRARQLLDRLDLIANDLHETDTWFYEDALVRYALRTGDVALLERVPVAPELELLRDWQIAVLKRDEAAEQAVYDAARSTRGELGEWLLLEAAARDGRFEYVAEVAPRLRARSRSSPLQQQVQLVEAWARWKLAQPEAACRLVSLEMTMTAPTPRQRERLDTLRRSCRSLGRTPWPGQ